MISRLQVEDNFIIITTYDEIISFISHFLNNCIFSKILKYREIFLELLFFFISLVKLKLPTNSSLYLQ